MREDYCGFCEALLSVHCEATGGEVCQIYKAYASGEIGADEALERFYKLVSHEQLVQLDPQVRKKMRELDPGRAAAEKWLHNYRHGKD